MASSSTGFWAAYNAVGACCASKGPRGPYHRHCGCALHFLPHEIHTPSTNESVVMPRSGMFKSLSIHSVAEKKSNGLCCGSPLMLQSVETFPVAAGQSQSSSAEKVLSIGLIQDSEEYDKAASSCVEYSGVAE